jgi:hypothetical protein
MLKAIKIGSEDFRRHLTLFMRTSIEVALPSNDMEDKTTAKKYSDGYFVANNH